MTERRRKMSVEEAYGYFDTGVLVLLGVLLLCVFIRVLRGPLLADRIVGINSIGTLVIVTVCLLAEKLNEEYLLDVAILYALVSFLAVVVLTKIYSGVYKNRIEQLRLKREREQAERAAAKASADEAGLLAVHRADIVKGSTVTDADKEVHNA
jgi:multicomponent Na+:H+ antiporter subunit F